MSISHNNLIAEAKSRLPLPDLMKQMGYANHAKKSCKSPFRQESSPSWGIYQGDKGWKWKDQGTGDTGDEIDFIAAAENLSDVDARARYFDLAGVKSDEKPTKRHGSSLPPSKAAQAASKRDPEMPFDWLTCCNNLTDDLSASIASWRGLTPETISTFRDHKLIGVYAPWPKGSTPCVAFPVNNDEGMAIGCHYRLNAESAKAMTEAVTNGHIYSEGSWMYSKGATTRPLIIGDPATATDCLILESQWDALAIAEGLGWHEGRIDTTAFVITRGAQNGKAVAGIPMTDARVVAIPQNDKPKKGDKNTPAEKWLADIRDALPDNDVLTARVPADHKDANDWRKAGATDEDVTKAIRDAQEPAGAIKRRSLATYAVLPINDKDTLLGNRWLCRAGALLFVAPSGIGKSSASAQMDALWANGREAFGIMPSAPLRILTVQVENDEGDLTEMSHGVLNGLELSAAEIQMVDKNTRIVTLNGSVGDVFFKKLRNEMRRFKPDIVRIDPITGFHDKDVGDAEACNHFCRAMLHPLLTEFNCACILVAHTPKTNHRDTSKWKATDWMYAAAGCADWTNFCRTVMVIEPTDYPVFKFIATKRKGRIGWVDVTGAKVSERFFKHNDDHDGLMFWREATPTEQNHAIKAEKTKYALLDLVPETGSIDKVALISLCQSIGIGRDKADGWIAELVHGNTLIVDDEKRGNARAKKVIRKPSQKA